MTRPHRPYHFYPGVNISFPLQRLYVGKFRLAGSGQGWNAVDGPLQQGQGDSNKLSSEAATGWRNYKAVASRSRLTPAERQKPTGPEPTEPADEFSRPLA